MLWQAPLAGDLAEVVSAEGGRYTLADSTTREQSIFTVASAVRYEAELDLDEEDGGDDDGEVAVDSTTIAALNAATGELIWNAGFGGEALSVLPLGPDRLALCLHNRRTLRALDRASGHSCWQRRLPAEGSVRMAASAGLWYVADGQTLLALEGSTGEPRWQQALDGVASAVQTTATGVVAATGAGSLVAFDSSQGGRLWELGLSTSQMWRFADDLAVVVEVQGGVGALVCLELASGRKRWRYGLDRNDDIVAGLERDGRYLGVQTQQDRILMLDLESGAELWRVDETENLTTWAGGGLFLVGTDERLASLDPAGGRPLWEIPFEVWSVAIDAPAGVVYVAGGGRVTSLEPATGSTRWVVTLPSQTHDMVVDRGGSIEETQVTAEAEVLQLVPDGRGRLFAVADQVLYAIG